MNYQRHDLDALANRFGTPLFVTNAHRLGTQAEDLSQALALSGRPGRLYFSVKANPLPSMIARLIDAGVGMLVMSEFELRLALACGVDSEALVVHGVARKPGLATAAVRAQVGLIVVECQRDLDETESAAQVAGRSVPVGLRIRRSSRRTRVNLGGSGPQGFAMSSRRDARPAGLEEAIIYVAGSDHLELRSLSFHVGTGLHRTDPFAEAAQLARRAWEMALGIGLRPTVLNIGGGFGLSDVQLLSTWQLLGSLVFGRRPNLRESPSAVELVAAIARRVRREFAALGDDGPNQVIAEPGRALAGPAQTLVLTVTDVGNEGGRLYAVCDGGALSLSALLLAEQHRIVVAGTRPSGPLESYDLIGDTPAPLDLIARGVRLPPLRPGDRIAIHDVGAYVGALSTNFSGPRAGVVEIDRAGVRLVRRRERFEDILARDLALAEDSDATDSRFVGGSIV